MIELTQEQLETVQGGDLVELVAPEIGNRVVLLRADAFEVLREQWLEERARRVLASVAARNASARAEEL